MLDQLFQFSGSTLTIGDIRLTFSISGILEILIFSVVCYYIILWIKHTKAWDLLKGAGVLLGLYIISRIFGLSNITYLFHNMVGSLVIAVIIILQPEIRSALERLGKNRMVRQFLLSGRKAAEIDLNQRDIEEIVKAMAALGKNKVGALIVIENKILLDEYISTGIHLDANISAPLLEQIFEHNTPLHDGAVIIRAGRIISATCYLPLTKNNDSLSKELGTRHRAALGISEVSDAITLVASEETGKLSVTQNGVLEGNISAQDIRNILADVQVKPVSEGKESFFEWLKRRTQNEKAD